MKISDKFKSIALREDATEREIHAFLKKYPYVLIHLFNTSWDLYKIFPEFRMGTDFRADFVIISADSGAWHGRFIELEGPNDSPYTKAGISSKKLNWALHQTNEWNNFIYSHKPNLMHEFAKLIKPLKRSAQNNLMGRGVLADIELEHPETYIDFYYHVVIGNSKRFSESDRKAHKKWAIDGVATYDRLYNAICELESRFGTIEQQRVCLSNSGH